MGKASRTKRERKERDEAVASGTLPRIEAPKERRSLPVFWIVIALIVVGGLVALIVTAPDDDTKAREAKVKDIPVYADVTVDGTKLVEPSDSQINTTDDPAVGKTVPTLSGTSITTGKPLTITPGEDGDAMVYIVMAHWCPHCNTEIPEIVEWAKDGNLPDGVKITGVSTSADDGNPNFPPATWLVATMKWPWDAMIDDEVGTGAEALGTTGFPFLVFVNGDGTVAKRFSGEMPIDDFADEVKDIAKTATTPKKDA